MKISVLDHGYVRYQNHWGDDLTVVNAARVSFDKASDWDPDTQRLKPKDRKLLRYLIQHDHTSPLRHAGLTLEVYAPMMVMRQWGKYRVGSHWTFEGSDDPFETINESSRRYVTEEPVFYIPTTWEAAAADAKQGSGDRLPHVIENWLTNRLDKAVRDGVWSYNDALQYGASPEKARLFLPAYGMYLRAWWTVSLHGVLHFLDQRLQRDAQIEIRQYAEAVRDIVAQFFPETKEEWLG